MSDISPASGRAYVVGQISIKDPVRWASYREQVPDTLLPWHGELVFRAMRAEVFAGQNPHRDVVVIRFPDLAAARGWFMSNAYQALIPLREQAAAVDLNCYESEE